METGMIHIDGDTVTLTGFTHLTDDVTFRFSPLGITLSSVPKTPGPDDYNVHLKNCMIISNELAGILLKRGVKDGEEFFYMGGVYYNQRPKV